MEVVGNANNHLWRLPMHAAVVTAYDTPPAYGDHPDPVAGSDNEMVVEVLAAGLHRLMGATGSAAGRLGAW
jgi:hypothetical protein